MLVEERGDVVGRLDLPAPAPHAEEQLRRTAEMDRLSAHLLHRRGKWQAVCAGPDDRDVELDLRDLPAHVVERIEPRRVGALTPRSRLHSGDRLELELGQGPWIGKEQLTFHSVLRLYGLGEWVHHEYVVCLPARRSMGVPAARG